MAEGKFNDVSRAIGGIEQSVKDIKDTLSRIEAQTIRTNGRVTALEKVNNIRRGQMIAYGSVAGVIMTVTAEVAKHYLGW